MAKPSIASIATTQTFQNWLDKTNEMVNIFRNEAITASSSGDSTTGDATLVGDFTATNLVADTLLSSDAFSSQTGGATIDFQSPINITASSSEICATFTYGSTGGRTRYTDGSTSWDVGMEDSTSANFIIDTGVGDSKFELSPAGTLTVKNIIVDETITANTITGALTGANTDDVEEGDDNLYFTTTRAQAAIDKRWVDLLKVDANTLADLPVSAFVRTDGSNGVVGNLTATGNFSGDGLSTTTFMTNYGTLYVGGTSEFEDSVTIDGSLSVSGVIITDWSTSDINLKTDLEVIDSPLEKIELINGYTYTLKKRPNERLTGLVAQELEEVLPEAVYVFEDDDGVDRKGIHYGNTVSLLVEAIKELKCKVDELERKASGEKE